jgi:hypothetical protein
MTHDEISFLCRLWNCQSPEQFYEKMNALTDEELKKEIERVRKKRKILLHYLSQQEVIYS